MDPKSSPRALVIGSDQSRVAHLVRRLETMGIRCVAADLSEPVRRRRLQDQADVVVAVEVAGSWQPTRLILQSTRDAAEDLPLMVVSEAASDSERAGALESDSAGIGDWVEATRSDREIASRVRRLAGSRRLAMELEELRRLTAAAEPLDRLTALAGHRLFHETLDREFRRARRYPTCLSLILCDLDRFKAVNDLHGHAVGDRLLQEIGRGLGSSLREIDTAARYGGDEFALVLPQTDADAAAKVAERTRAYIGTVADGPASSPVRGAAGERIRLTASLGLATFPSAAAATHLLLLECAEAALLRAKQEGRNRVVPHDGRAPGETASVPHPPPPSRGLSETGTWSG